MFVIKAICYVLTRSVAIFAATLDSLMDLTSQAVNYFTRWNSESEKFPFGREKLSSVGTLICSILMVGMNIGNLLKILEELIDGSIDGPEQSDSVLIVLGIGICLKTILFLYCRLLPGNLDQVLAQDHFNDCITNLIALTCS